MKTRIIRAIIRWLLGYYYEDVKAVAKEGKRHIHKNPTKKEAALND